MRICSAIGFVLLLCRVAACPAADPPRTDHDAASLRLTARSLLGEAAALALKQGEQQRSWSDGVLLDVAEVQARAGDFDGASRSIGGTQDVYRREGALFRLAEALARDGKRDRAFEALRLIDRKHSCGRDDREDEVQLRWVEHLIASGDLARADRAVGQLKTERYRANALRLIAVADARAGNGDRAARQFARAVQAAASSETDRERAWMLWETADAQLAVGQKDAARATIRRLVEATEFKDPWARFEALTQGAALAAKAKDDEAAHRLFRRALEAQKAVDAPNKMVALAQVAAAQAGAGYFDDALKTVALMKRGGAPFTRIGEPDVALSAIAVAQLKAGDVHAAVRTARSIERYRQYRDDALQEMIDHLIAKRDLKTAADLTKEFDDPSRKATGTMKVAAAYARAGDRKTGAGVAARIELSGGTGRIEHFDYRDARTWGVAYGASGYFSITSYLAALQTAAEVAAAAMALAQALGQKPGQPYAELFQEVDTPSIIRALARSHAATGDAAEAVAWAGRIGSGGKVKSMNDDATLRAVEQRVHALVGAAEGILDRTGVPPQPGR